MEKVESKKTFRSKLSNYWFYYKWQTIIAIVLIFTVSVATVQCASKKKYDYQIMLACSSYQLAESQISAIAKVLEPFANDINGDGIKNIEILDCTYSNTLTPRDMVNAKKQKIQSVIMNSSKALLIISDDNCFKWLNSITKSTFMENLNLPDDDGLSYNLDTNGLYKKAISLCSDQLKWPQKLKISRRIVKNTLIEKDNDIEQNVKDCDGLLNKIIAAEPIK